MAGHNKWKRIKHKKTSADQARGKLFSKLANEISIAARTGTDPQFNPSLRSAVDRARKQNMPQANIEKAIKRVSDRGGLEEILVETYGPGGVGILIVALTDNKNRTIGELRSVLKKYDVKIAAQGSLLWSFDKTPGGYEPKLGTDASDEVRVKVRSLSASLEEIDNVVGVHTSVKT